MQAEQAHSLLDGVAAGKGGLGAVTVPLDDEAGGGRERKKASTSSSQHPSLLMISFTSFSDKACSMCA